MSFNDRPLHLSDLSIYKKMPHQEPSVTVPVWVTQSSLDGLQALIHEIKGIERGGGGQLAGSFELVMFYRTLVSSIRAADDANRSAHVEENAG